VRSAGVAILNVAGRILPAAVNAAIWQARPKAPRRSRPIERERYGLSVGGRHAEDLHEIASHHRRPRERCPLDSVEPEPATGRAVVPESSFRDGGCRCPMFLETSGTTLAVVTPT
jgi:hypothetical protein